MFSDFKYALRQLARSPGFTIVSIATLGIGIGANTAIFSMVSAALLKPLPFAEPDRIVNISEMTPSGWRFASSTLNFLDWQKQNSVFEFMTVARPGTVSLTGTGKPAQLNGSLTSARYFDLLGAKAALGRTFAPDEDQAGKNHVVVVSHKLWQLRFGGDPAIIGHPIELDGEPYTVIGVMPGGTYFDRAWTQLYRPLTLTAQNMSRDYHWLNVQARLKRGVTLEQAQAQMATIAAQIAHDYPASNKGWGISVDRLATMMIGPQLHQALYTLLGAVGMILLIACANLANLMLARTLVREREVAIRASLGADRWRLMRQFLAESALVSLGGGVLGLALGYAMLVGLKLAMPPNLYATRFIPPAVNVTLDGQVLIFTLGLSVLTGIIFGLVPALQATRPDLAGAMKQSGPGTSAGKAGRRLRSALVISEVALAFILLTGAGLLIRSLFQMLKEDTGFDSTNVITAGLPIPEKQFPNVNDLKAYLRQIDAGISALPGVRSVALTDVLPLRGWGAVLPFQIAGRTVVGLANRPLCFFKSVSPSYFEALGIRLHRGRALNDHDVGGVQPVAVINETMARKYFPNASPIGRQILMPDIVPGKTQFSHEIPWTVVGVVANEKVDDLGYKEESPGVYVSNEQSPTFYQALIVRGAADPAFLQQAITKTVAKINRDQILTDMMTLEQIKSESTGNQRFVCLLIGIFGGAALLLSAMGIYGVISYSVAQRTHEIGIRGALGANSGNLLGLILGDGLRLAAIGLLVGIAGAFALTRLISSLLFNVGAQDPAALTLAAGILVMVALLACYIPARRATKVNPVIALRVE